MSPVPGYKSPCVFGKSSGFALGNKTPNILMGDVTKITPLAQEWGLYAWVFFLPIEPFQPEWLFTNHYSPITNHEIPVSSLKFPVTSLKFPVSSLSSLVTLSLHFVTLFLP